MARNSVALCAALALAITVSAENTTTTAAPEISQPKMSTKDGNLMFSVTRDMDVTFQRARSNEEVTLWGVHDRLQALKGEGLDAVEKRVMSYADSRLDSIKAKIASIYARQFEVAAATLQSGVGASGVASLASNAGSRIGMMEARLKEYDEQLKSTIAIATAGLKDSILGVTNDIKAVQDALSARQAQVANEGSSVGAVGVNLINKRASAASQGASRVASSVAASLDEQVASIQKAAADAQAEIDMKAARAPTNLPWTVMSIGHMNDGRDNAVLRTFTFNKKFDDTALQITWNGDARMYGNGHRGNWYFRVDNRDCRCVNGDGRCHIDTSFHASQWKNMHRTMEIDGICFRNTAGIIKAGSHSISIHVSANGDAYTGWSSNNRFMVREIPMPINVVG